MTVTKLVGTASYEQIQEIKRLGYDVENIGEDKEGGEFLINVTIPDDIHHVSFCYYAGARGTNIRQALNKE